jgi:hypothetical protein
MRGVSAGAAAERMRFESVISTNEFDIATG